MNPETKKIMFVDDEESILRALRQTFRHEPYQLHFFSSPQLALEYLSDNPVDMVVSDFRMPKLNGYEFLRIVKQRNPKVIRLLLSSYTEDKIVFKALFGGISKAYIVKPWNDDSLKEYIRNVFDLYESLTASELKAYIDNIEHLPTLPDIYFSLVEAMYQEKEIEEIVGIVEHDPSWAVKVLQVVNSAFYGVHTTSIKSAIIFIGLEALRDIILTHSVSKDIFFTVQQKKDAEFVEKYIYYVNLYTHKILEILDKKDLRTQFGSLGLLGNIGLLILLKNYPQKFALYLADLKEANHLNYHALENKHFQFSHAILGGYFLHWWNLPYCIIEAVTAHYPMDFNEKKISEPSLILHLADVLAWKKLGYLENYELNDAILAKLNVNRTLFFDIISDFEENELPD